MEKINGRAREKYIIKKSQNQEQNEALGASAADRQAAAKAAAKESIHLPRSMRQRRMHVRCGVPEQF